LVREFLQLLGARTFYASTHGDQAKRIAKARRARDLELISESARRKKISLVVPSTGNSPTINRFSTALTGIAAHTTLAA